MGNYYQGKYTLNHPEKYKGNSSNIVFRSSWEYKAFGFCDNNPSIAYWNSEETVIPYVSPLDGRVHRYFMDLKVWIRAPDGSFKITLIEIKPYAETIEPLKKQGKKKETLLREYATWNVNEAKWAAARALCAKEGWNFIIWTEKELLPNMGDSVLKMKSQRTYEEKMKKAFKKKTSPQVALLAMHLKNKIKEKL